MIGISWPVLKKKKKKLEKDPGFSDSLKMSSFLTKKSGLTGS